MTSTGQVTVRWTNVVLGTALALISVGFALFGLAQLPDYAREPEDVWLAVAWMIGAGLLAGICGANAQSGAERSRLLLVVNVIVLAALVLVLVAWRKNALALPTAALCALGPAVALVRSLAVRIAAAPGHDEPV